MAKFLNTSATSYFLEELIKNARDRLILISPFLQLNNRIKELLADKNRLKIDVRIVYGKDKLQIDEIEWLNELAFVRTSFLQNLHAKCYISEDMCIITSMNLYEFSERNNNEMGVLFSREEDPDLYREAYEEAQRIIRSSEEVRISMQRVPKEAEQPDVDEENPGNSKLTSSKLALKLGMKTAQLIENMVAEGFLELKNDKPFLTEKGKAAGGEFRKSQKYGYYFIWPEGFGF